MDGDDFIADDFEPDAESAEPEEPPAEASLPGYETRTARALVLPQVDVVGDPSAPAEGPSMGSATMREGPGEMRDITVAQKTAPAARVDAASPERSRTEVLRDMVRATMGDRGSMERTSGGAGATRSPLLTRVERDVSDATAGSSEGTTGMYRGGEAGVTGLVDGATFGFGDEMRGLARGGIDGYREERDAARAEQALTREQNPGLYLAGEAAGSVASGLAAAPLQGAQAATGAARIGQAARAGAGFGAMSGFGHSDGADLPEMAFDTAEGAVGGAITGGVTGAAIEGARAVPAGIARWLESRAAQSAEAAVPARLEASGVWGGRAMRAADEMRPGGAEGLARDLRAMRAGEQPGGILPTVPVATRALDDALAAGERGVDRMGAAAREADAAGARVDLGRVVDDVEQLAQQAEGLGTRTAIEAARRIREEVAPLATRGGAAPAGGITSVEQAWALRRHLDDMARWGAQAADGSFVEMVRGARRALDGRMDEALMGAAPEILEEWNQATRQAQIGAFMEQHGRGGQRLSGGGGIAGASGAGDVISEAVRGRNPASMLASVAEQGVTRGIAQYGRVRQAGATARIHETIADRAPQVSAFIMRSMQSGGQALGPYAQRFRQAMERAAPAQAVSTLHYLLSQSDPAYRAQIERARQEQADGNE